MTEKLFWEDPYLKEFDAKILHLDGNRVVLDRTAFYPTGGGQPGDTGTFSISGFKTNVEDVSKEGDNVIHTVSDVGHLHVGAQIRGNINWEMRYSFMRHHSAIHIMDGIVTRRHKDEGLLTGGQIYFDRARIDLDMQNFSRELIESIIDECNSFISEGHNIYEKVITREEALSMENLARTEPGRQLINSLESVRLIVIDDLDEQADGGTHVKNSKEIGRIVLKKIESKGRRNKRVEFRLEDV